MNIRIKNNKGITLIALVITIIVLLILAGVTIASLTGENGILTRAQTSRKNTEDATVEEKVKLAVQSAYTEGKGIVERGNLDNELKDLFGTGNYELSDGDAPWTVTVEDYEATVNSKGKVAKTEQKDPDDQDPPKPGNPDEEGYFTEPSTINGGEVSATNPKIPAGFMPVDEGEAVWGDGTTAPTEDAVDEGLVIQDKNDNQFVWVPVAEFTDFEREAGYLNGAQESITFTSTGLTSGQYYEPEGDGETVDTTASEDIQEAQKMYKSVKENKGFYIGRYETGFEGTTAKSAYTSYTTYTQTEVNTETEKLLVQANKQVYNYVPWGAGVSDTSALNKGTADSPAYVIGAVELARNFDSVNNYEGVTSTLCYGVQRDAVMRWMKDEPNPNVNGKTYIQDSTGMGWHSDNSDYAVQKTGIDVDVNASNKVKNIYDMAGNVYEWTMEAYDTYGGVYRGGYYCSTGSYFPASNRSYIHPSFTEDFFGFRLTLFM